MNHADDHRTDCRQTVRRSNIRSSRVDVARTNLFCRSHPKGGSAFVSSVISQNLS